MAAKQLVTTISLFVILVSAGILRLTGIDWDNYYHYHPDERYMAWVATTIEMPQTWEQAVNPRLSPLNPYYWHPQAQTVGVVVPQDQPRQFAYGHLPLYIGVFAAKLVEWVTAQGDWAIVAPPSSLIHQFLNLSGQPEYHHLLVVGRLVTAMVDMGTVVILFLLGQTVWRTSVGLVAAGLLAFNVLHIQLAHFWTVDPFLTFFVVATIYCLVRAIHQPRWTWVAAICIGLAIGSKFAGIFLIIPLLLLLSFKERRWQPLIRQTIPYLFLILATFALTNPYALLDFNCDTFTPEIRLDTLTIPEIHWRNCFLENVVRQNSMVSGQSDTPFARQYAGTTPFLYPVEMQIKWGMGLFLGITAWVSFGGWLIKSKQHRSPQLWLILGWMLLFFGATGGLYAKFMRYEQPLMPFLLLMTASFLMPLPITIRPSIFSRFIFYLSRFVLALAFGQTVVYTLAFVQIYQQPHPWVLASEWIYAHVPAQSLILTEQWDDPLPMGPPSAGISYRTAELSWLTGIESADNFSKLQTNLELLAQADYLLLASPRVYGVVPRLPELYPISHQYHPLLFTNRLGYEQVYVGYRAPNLWQMALYPDPFPPNSPWSIYDELTQQSDYLHIWNLGRADESFTVYDQPLVLIFANTGQLSATQMLELFELPIE